MSMVLIRNRTTKKEYPVTAEDWAAIQERDKNRRGPKVLEFVRAFEPISVPLIEPVKTIAIKAPEEIRRVSGSEQAEKPAKKKQGAAGGPRKQTPAN